MELGCVYLWSQNFIIRSQPESFESVARPRILFSEISVNVILPSALTVILLQFFHCNFKCVFHPLHACYIHRLSSYQCPNHQHSIRRRLNLLFLPCGACYIMYVV